MLENTCYRKLLEDNTLGELAMENMLSTPLTFGDLAIREMLITDDSNEISDVKLNLPTQDKFNIDDSIIVNWFKFLKFLINY